MKFYCNKNGEIFVIEIYNLSNKIVLNNDNKKEENEVTEFNIDNNENKEKDKNKNENNKSRIFYITVLSKESSNKGQAKNINKIINKKFGEIFKK